MDLSDICTQGLNVSVHCNALIGVNQSCHLSGGLEAKLKTFLTDHAVEYSLTSAVTNNYVTMMKNNCCLEIFLNFTSFSGICSSI